MNRRILLLGVVGALAVVALWWVVIFSPKSSDLHDARNTLSSARTSGETLQAQLTQLKGLAARSTQTEAELGKLSAAIPKTPNQASFITGLNDIADASGITWQSVTMQPPAASAGGAPETIVVQIQIQGGFFQALDYMNRLEDLDRLVVVDGVNVANKAGTVAKSASGGVTGGSSELTATLNARIFAQNTTGSTASSGATTSGGTNTGTPGTTGQVVN